MTEDAKLRQFAQRKQRAALASTGASLGLTLVKLGAGALSGSLALISEGAHNALDIAVSASTYFAVREADKPPDEEHPFGHAKIEAVAALAQTGFLFALSAAVAYVAFARIGEGAHAIDANVYAFGAIVLSLAIDIIRWRGLTKVARETGSDALAADALHYSSDLVSSLLVLLGLLASRFGFVDADPIAAIGVAIFIVIVGFRLGRRTIDALVDAAPKGLANEVRKAVEAAPGVAGVDFLRLRRSGPRVVGDLGFFVSRTLPIERVVTIKGNLARALAERWPMMELTQIASPRALDDESVLERVQLIANRRRLFVHHVTIQHVARRACVSLDLEVDGRMGLGSAHEIASKLEEAIRHELGDEIEVETHIEPLETRELDGADADLEAMNRFRDALKRLAASEGALVDIHNIRLRVVAGGYYGIFHCRVAPDTSVESAHARVDALEHAVKSEMPELLRVIGHVEPVF